MRAPARPLTAAVSQAAARPGHPLQGALRSILRLLWFVLIPLLLSGLGWRYFVPHASSAPGVEGALAAFARGHGAWLMLLLFLSFAGLVRYWRNWLPGGRYLSTLPHELVARVPRRRIAACESACALLLTLERRPVSRQIDDSSAELRHSLQAARAELDLLLGTGKWSKVPPVFEKLELLARPFRPTKSTKNQMLFFALLGGAALVALQIRARYLQTYEVIGTSMLPTLTPGEMLAGSIAKYTPGQLPRRGDVVVLHTIVDGAPREVIKRVVGLPGDRIAMNGVHPVINGWPVPVCEAGAYYSPNDETARSGNPSALLVMEFLEGEAYLTLQAVAAAPVSEYVVKPQEVFVLGDNRSNSRDSRAFDGGAPRGFPLADLKAHVTRVLFRTSPRGDIDLRSALTPLGPIAFLDGADVSGIQARIAGCLAVRPKTASPPRSASAALAFHD